MNNLNKKGLVRIVTSKVIYLACNIYILIFVLFSSCTEETPVKIKFTHNIQGDFSFKDKWSYAEWVFVNDIGELVCDGLCQSEVFDMVDENGHIIPEYKNQYYELVDTSHLYYSIKSDMFAIQDSLWYVTTTMADKTIRIASNGGVSTYFSLIIEILPDGKCTALYEFVSPANVPKEISELEGYIEIDKNSFDKGIIKAKFDLFNHTKRYAGLIYSNYK